MASNEIPINRTKVVIPTLRPEILHRARLLALFDFLLEKKLILMTAPAGYGKTSLLVDFARQAGMPVGWLSLDALDKDPQRFFTYIIAALAECFPNFGKRSNAVVRTITSFEQDSERLLSSLINEVADQIDEHFVLVVDDYQFVDFIPNIRDLFSRFVSMVGENCHVILSSRRLPTLPDITLMVARQQVSGFDLEELAFRRDEISTLFEKNYGVKLAEEAAEELVRQTEGWITGLHLSASEVRRAAPDPSTAVLMASRMRAARATGVDLAVYLDQQVLSQQSPELLYPFRDVDIRPRNGRREEARKLTCRKLPGLLKGLLVGRQFKVNDCRAIDPDLDRSFLNKRSHSLCCLDGAYPDRDGDRGIAVLFHRDTGLLAMAEVMRGIIKVPDIERHLPEVGPDRVGIEDVHRRVYRHCLQRYIRQSDIPDRVFE